MNLKTDGGWQREPLSWRQLIVYDKPVSALDVSVEAQLVNLLQNLQEKVGLTYLFVAGDLSVVEQISTRVALMYHGTIVAEYT